MSTGFLWYSKEIIVFSTCDSPNAILADLGDKYQWRHGYCFYCVLDDSDCVTTFFNLELVLLIHVY